jgi:hypothetical protein
MAILTRVNGSLKPVMNVDVSSYTNGAPDANTVTNDATVNAFGPKLDFFTVDAGAAVTGDEMASALQTIQQLATVAIYNADLATGELALAVYPTGAWTAVSLNAAVIALGGGWAAVTTTASATFV